MKMDNAIINEKIMARKNMFVKVRKSIIIDETITKVTKIGIKRCLKIFKLFLL